MKAKPVCRHIVQGIEVEKREVTGSSGKYSLIAQGQWIGDITYSKVNGENNWFCGFTGCSYDDVHKLPVMLAHVVSTHTALSQRPLPTAAGRGIVGKASSVAMMADYRLAGLHPDPTAEQAIRNISAGW
ncbi:MAG: hypothetical protein H0U76_25415 [Ktedonobacteraceae bacterium]|nr:hypothetical protein [Ktedonobacteraceae bacterium]MBA3823723.1 hypothetical protein [Ktedonobacterales bacterium]